MGGDPGRYAISPHALEGHAEAQACSGSRRKSRKQACSSSWRESRKHGPEDIRLKRTGGVDAKFDENVISLIEFWAPALGN